MAETLGHALIDAWTAALGSRARPRARPPAQSWAAQFNELTRSSRGQAALVAAGVNPGPGARNWRWWLAGERSPSKANQARIGAAYSSWWTGQADATATPATGRPDLWPIAHHVHALFGLVVIDGDARERGDGRAPLRVDGREGEWRMVNSLWKSYADPMQIRDQWVKDVMMLDLNFSTAPEFPGGRYRVQLE